MGEGSLTSAQAHVVVDAWDDLPEDLDPETRRAAEAHLVEQARHFEPLHLERLGRKVLEVVAPEVAEDHERRLVEAQERSAAKRTFLRFRRNGDGTTDIHARVADQVANRLRTYLEAFTNPRRHHLATNGDGAGGDRGLPPDAPSDDGQGGDDGVSTSSTTGGTTTEGAGAGGTGTEAPTSTGASTGGGAAGGGGATDLRPYAKRLGAAFGSLLEHLDPRRLPLHGGDATTLIVTIDQQVLTDALAGVGLVGQEPLSPAQARRLACTASILPAVLGGPSEVLDLGRARRLASAAQRKARALLDRTCRGEGCDVPAAWCECHHLDPRSRGGRTDLRDLRLLCSHHHHLAHDDRHEMVDLPDGRYRFRRRT